MSGIRTPLNATPAFALGQGKWLKEILRAGDLHYQGGTYKIDTDYLDSVVTSFNDKAIKRVPFQLADADNRHTQAPERRKGFIEGLRRNGESLEAIIDLDEDANQIVETDASFPVSVLINHNRTTGEGREFPAVLSHVLGTYDPVLTDLSDWVRLPEEIAASNDGGGDIIDFLALNAAEHSEPLQPATDATTDSPSSDEGATKPSKEAPAVADTTTTIHELLDADQRKKLLALLTADETPQDAPGDATSTDGTDTTAADPESDNDDDADESGDDTDESVPSDEDIEAMLATVTDLDDDTPEQVAAAHNATDADNSIALANMSAQLEEMRLANEVTSKKLAQSEWKTEKDAWIHANIPPHIVNLCEPFLNGASDKLSLSHSGDKAKVAEHLRKVLSAISKTAPDLGLSQGPIGTSEEADKAREEAEARAAKAAQVTSHLKKN